MLKPCDECLTLTSNPRFCSRNCSATYNNRKSPKRERLPTGVCVHCGEPADRRYLSHLKCTWAHRTGVADVEFLEAWKRGEIVVSRGDGHNRRFTGPARRVLLRSADNKCQLCGWGETNPHTGKIPLETDHINGDPYDDRFENLRVLCPNCHALTSTYKGANRGKGRTTQAPIV